MVHAMCAFFNRYGLEIDGYAATQQEENRNTALLPAEVVICQPHKKLTREDVHVVPPADGAAESTSTF